MPTTKFNPFLLLLFAQCNSCTVRTTSEEQSFQTEAMQCCWITIEHQGQTLSVLIPESFGNEALQEDTLLLPGNVRRTGVGRFYAANDLLVYIGAFVMPEMADEDMIVSDETLFETALRDGASISRQATPHSGRRYLLSFLNGDSLIVDVKLIWKSPVLFVMKSVQRAGTPSAELENFILSAR